MLHHQLLTSKWTYSRVGCYISISIIIYCQLQCGHLLVFYLLSYLSTHLCHHHLQDYDDVWLVRTWLRHAIKIILKLYWKVNKHWTFKRLMLILWHKLKFNMISKNKNCKKLMHDFTWQALQYLRKVCNHPSLVLSPQHPEFSRVMSQLKSDNSSMHDLHHAPKLVALKWARYALLGLSIYFSCIIFLVYFLDVEYDILFQD